LLRVVAGHSVIPCVLRGRNHTRASFRSARAFLCRCRRARMCECARECLSRACVMVTRCGYANTQ